MLKIAVCLSGLPRTINYVADHIINYFTSDDYTVDFFCHVWDYNIWKYLDESMSRVEPVDEEWLKSQILRFNPKLYLIENQDRILKNPKYSHLYWASSMYSTMRANHLKKKYEIENNFRYDFVVKGRYDTVYAPNRKFVPQNKILERTIYTAWIDRTGVSYNKLGMLDSSYYGDSWGMDIIADSFRYMYNEHPVVYPDDDIEMTQIPTEILRVCNNNNVKCLIDTTNEMDCFLRKEHIGKDLEKDYKEIMTSLVWKKDNI